MRILFLTAQLQPFLIEGVRVLVKKYNAKIFIYTKERDYDYLELPVHESITWLYYKENPNSSNYKQIVEFNPDIVFSAGWMYLKYLIWCSYFKKEGAQTICAMDTQWVNSFKQRTLTFFSKLFFRFIFTHCWIPGARQKKYALKLGFKTNQILSELYAPNIEKFVSMMHLRENYVYNRFICVSRLEIHKLSPLLEAYQRVHEKVFPLYIIGEGSLEAYFKQKYPMVVFLKQKTQQELIEFVGDSGGIFCLCSSNEPWGTVVQEFAAMGLPLLLTKQVGASDHFLNGNGLLCDANNIEETANKMLEFANMSREKLDTMSINSTQLASKSNSYTWAKKLFELYTLNC